MPELTITTEQLSRLTPALAAMAPLTPPPSAVGRYAIIKATIKAEGAFQAFVKAEAELTTRCAVPGSLKDVGNGRATFSVKPELTEEYATQRAALLAEPITLTGVRAITRAELGDCPITIQQDRVLVECGLLEAIPDE
jgi:hypothetical protein